jgi:predicted Zn-dependent protease
LLQIGCAGLRSANTATLPELGQAQAPLPAEEAQAAMRRIDATRDEAQCAQAVTLWQQGKPHESRKLLEGVLSRTADHPQARRLLADLALEAGEMLEAERLLLDLIKDHPDDTAARAALAWLYQSQEREEEAREQFQQIDTNFSPI